MTYIKTFVEEHRRMTVPQLVQKARADGLPYTERQIRNALGRVRAAPAPDALEQDARALLAVLEQADAACYGSIEALHAAVLRAGYEWNLPRLFEVRRRLQAGVDGKFLVEQRVFGNRKVSFELADASAPPPAANGNGRADKNYEALRALVLENVDDVWRILGELLAERGGGP